MASELTVQTLKGPTSGANANKIIVPSGQTLDLSSAEALIPGRILRAETVSITALNGFSSSSYVDSNIAISLTTYGTNSKFLITAGIGYNLQSTYTTGISLRLVANYNSTDYAIHTIGQGRSQQAAGGDNEFWAAFSIVYSPSISAGTNLIFKIQASSPSTGGVRTSDATESGMSVLEIAQ